MLGHAFHCRGIFGNESVRSLEGHPCRIIKRAPGMLVAFKQGWNQKTGRSAVGDTLPGVASDQVNMIGPGDAADEACKVYRLQHLPGPSVGNFSDLAEAHSSPDVQSVEPC